MKRLGLIMAALGLAALACTLLGGGGNRTPTPEVTNTPEGKPTVVIDAPPSGAQTAVNQQVYVQSTSTDAAGVSRVVLVVDGAQVSSDESPDPEGQPTLTLLQSWTPSTAGTHTLTVTAYRADGTASDPATITLNVVDAAAVAATLPPPPMLANLPPTQTGGPCQSIIRQHLNVRDGPDISYDKLYTLAPGTIVPVSGRNANNSWRYVDYPGGSGWMSNGQQYSYSSGDCSNLPVFGPEGPQLTLTPDLTLTPEVEYAPSDSDYNWDVGRDDGTVQFTEYVSYPDGDTEDQILFAITDFTTNPGEDARDVTFTLICLALESSSSDDVEYDAGGSSEPCGQSLVVSLTEASNTVTLTVGIGSGDYAYVQYTLNAIITPP